MRIVIFILLYSIGSSFVHSADGDYDCTLQTPGCANGGTCERQGDRGHKCRCPTGFQGDNCEIRLPKPEVRPGAAEGGRPGGVITETNPASIAGQGSATWFSQSESSKDEYTVVSDKKTCREAAEICEGKLAFLATSTSSTTNDYLVQLLAAKNIQFASIGYWKEKFEQTFKWQDGSTSTYTNWQSPVDENTLVGANCYCSFIQRTNKQWFFSDCSSSTSAREFICQRPKDLCSSTIRACEGGVCVRDGDHFKCVCESGQEGERCTDIDECASNPCVRGACTNLKNAFQCMCPDGYTGSTCAQEIDECESNPCINGAKCYDDLNEYRCLCPENYNGTFCEAYYPPPAGVGGDKEKSTSKGSIVPIVVPIIIVVILIIVCIIVLVCLRIKKKKLAKEVDAMNDEEKQMKKAELALLNAEFDPNADTVQLHNASWVEPLNDVAKPPPEDRVQYSDIIPRPPTSNADDTTDSEPLMKGHYADLRFPGDPNTSMSSDDKPRPQPRKKPRAVPRQQSLESPYATTDIVHADPNAQKRRPKPRKRPKSMANLADALPQDTSSEVEPPSAPPKPAAKGVKREPSMQRSRSRDALNDLTLDPDQDSYNDVKNRLENILANPNGSLYKPVVHPRPLKSILKPPKAYAPPPNDRKMAGGDQRNGGVPRTAYAGAAGAGAGTTV